MPPRKRSNWRQPTVFDDDLYGGGRRTTRAARSGKANAANTLRDGTTVNISRSKQTVQKWVEVWRPPAMGIGFEVPQWVPYDKLTEQERLEYEAATQPQDNEPAAENNPQSTTDQLVSNDNMQLETIEKTTTTNLEEIMESFARDETSTSMEIGSPDAPAPSENTHQSTENDAMEATPTESKESVALVNSGVVETVEMSIDAPPSEIAPHDEAMAQLASQETTESLTHIPDAADQNLTIIIEENDDATMATETTRESSAPTTTESPPTNLPAAADENLTSPAQTNATEDENDALTEIAASAVVVEMTTAAAAVVVAATETTVKAIEAPLESSTPISTAAETPRESSTPTEDQEMMTNNGEAIEMTANASELCTTADTPADQEILTNNGEATETTTNASERCTTAETPRENSTPTADQEMMTNDGEATETTANASESCTTTVDTASSAEKSAANNDVVEQTMEQQTSSSNAPESTADSASTEGVVSYSATWQDPIPVATDTPSETPANETLNLSTTLEAPPPVPTADFAAEADAAVETNETTGTTATAPDGTAPEASLPTAAPNAAEPNEEPSPKRQRTEDDGSS